MINNSETFQNKCKWKTSCNLIDIPTTDDIKFNGEVLDIRFCKSKAACIRRDNCCDRWGEGEGDLGLISWEVKVSEVGDRGRGEGGGVLDRAVSVDIRVGGEGSERHKTETEIKRFQFEFFRENESQCIKPYRRSSAFVAAHISDGDGFAKIQRAITGTSRCYIPCFYPTCIFRK